MHLQQGQSAPGEVVWLGEQIRRVIAPNPSPMTHWGTNTYIVGRGGGVAVIDPGPNEPRHLAALLAALAPGERISHILVTHAHLDHSPLAWPLAQATGAPVLAHGRARDGQSALMADLLARGFEGGGEGLDHDFLPDRRLQHGEEIAGDGWRLTALHTPGHMANHMCFDMQGHVFTGDHVMGWASSLVSPPDGDLGQFMASCALLAARNDIAYYPGHGAPVADPGARIQWLIAHRKDREAAIIAALRAGPMPLAALTRQVYTDTPPELMAMAERNVLAHLLDLNARALVVVADPLDPAASFEIGDPGEQR